MDPGERHRRNQRGDPGEEKVGSSCDSEAHVDEELVDVPIHCQHEWTTDFDRGYLQLITKKAVYVQIQLVMRRNIGRNCVKPKIAHLKMAQTPGGSSTRNS